MKKLLLLFIIVVFIKIPVAAQVKPGATRDTTQHKPSAETDSTRVKFPLDMRAVKFSRIDSADLSLSPAAPIEKYGVIDSADLKMTSCDFEKDANAMILFDRGEMALGVPEIILERQTRIKIFNDNGKDEANIRIKLNNRFGEERILGIEGETINLDHGKITYTKLQPDQIYRQHTDEQNDEIVFSMPNVKAGSVIEYRYAWARNFSMNFPKWDFQSDIPARYSQLEAFINPMLVFSVYSRTSSAFVQNTASNNGLSHVWALANIPSTKAEPFMRSAADAAEKLMFVISGVDMFGQKKETNKSWADLGKEVAAEKAFYKPYSQDIHDENEITGEAKKLKTDSAKIEFLFNKVKNTMKWNEDKNWISKDGIKNAWKKRTGNWGEINMVLCNLLNKSGIKALPMLVSTRDNGSIIPAFVNFYQINKLVVYVPVDSSKYYVLDASDKFNAFNAIPYDLLNSYGLYLDKEKENYALVYMQKTDPVRQVVLINAAINGKGTMKGTARLVSFGYNKSSFVKFHTLLDDKKYRQLLTEDDNNLQIDSLGIKNADADSLPLVQHIHFTLNLPGTDGEYIYFNPNLFTSLYNNPFVNKERVSDIDFGYCNAYSIKGVYKLPEGYAVESLPSNIDLVIHDRSITFRRLSTTQNKQVFINYLLSYKKSVYPQSEYPDIYSYFKKLIQLLNEPIVLKKT